MARYACRAVTVVVLALLPGILSAIQYDSAHADTRAGDDLTLIVGGQDEMKTRNLLQAMANDVWTRDVLERIYHPVLLEDRTGNLRPYVIKGVDADGDGIFQRDEYGKFLREAKDWQGNPCDATVLTNFCALTVTAFYDFNGVYFHDGAQADVWDLLFTYHLFALNPRFNTDLRVIMDVDFTNNRQMDIAVVDATSVPPVTWADLPPAGASATLRASLKFVMKEPFALFYESTLSGTIFPQHAWEKTGQRGDAPVTPYATSIHGDFGCLIYPATASGAYTDTTKKGTGIPLGAGDLPSACTTAYNYPAAEGWAMTDADVIGTGPFKFETWVQGGFAKVVRNDQFFVGQNPYSPFEIWDPYLLTYIKLPTIDAIVYIVYKSMTLGVLALKRAVIDFYHWSIPAEFVPDLLNEPGMAIEANPEPGFTYLGYNLRRIPFGYDGGGIDVGYSYRRAVSHLIDKKTIVGTSLSNFGFLGDGYISPANTFWYNDNILKPVFDPALADSILDAAYSAWSPGPTLCTKDTPSACRSLPGLGTANFQLLTPQADYEPTQAAAGQMVTYTMQSVGINVVSTPLAFGEIAARLDNGTFDEYILNWRIGGTDPDYLCNFYPGFNNATFDQICRDSRAELNRTLRHDLIFTAQEILADARPYEVLYYRTNIEGYRQDRFVNWTVSSGTIWNYYSLLGIRPPSEKRLTITPTLPSAVASGATAPLTVTVYDQARNRVVGANVRLKLAPNTGGLGNATATDVNLTADANGQVLIDYYAPIRQVNDTSLNVLIDMTASHPEFADSGYRDVQIAIFPCCDPAFLAISVWLPQGDVMLSGGMLPLEIDVTDQDGTPFVGANVTVETSNTLVVASPNQTTSRAGLTVMLSAAWNPALPSGVDVTITAWHQGHVRGVTAVHLEVLPSGDCPPGRLKDPVTGSCMIVDEEPPADPIIGLAALAGVVASALVILYARQRRPRPRPPP